MKVVWTEQAFERLADIEDFIARDDSAAGERFVGHLIDRAETLSDHPGLGRILPELPRSDLRELVEGNYRIVYRVQEQTIAVLTVFEGHRLLPVDDLNSDEQSPKP